VLTIEEERRISAMVKGKVITAFLVLAGLLLVASFPLPAAHGQGSTTDAPAAATLCVEWDITGRWTYSASGGGYGWLEFQQDAAGNLTGTFWNEASQGGGNISSGKMHGVSFEFEGPMGDRFEGMVFPEGANIGGTFTIPGGFSGNWYGEGAARCVTQPAPPPPGKAKVKIEWGDYVYHFEAEFVPTALGLSQPAQPAQAAPPVIPSPTCWEGWLQMEFPGTGLPGTVYLWKTENDVDMGWAGYLYGQEVGGWTVYRGRVSVPQLDLAPGQIITIRIFGQDPTNPDRSTLLATVIKTWIDPAGNIYNAATSEVLPDAMCFLYKKKGSDWLLWPAAEFGQVNPLVSTVKGHYAWYTDAGEFKVKATKAGFSDGWGGPVTVPPEVTDLHIYLNPTTAPAPDLDDLVVADSSGVPETEYAAGETIEAQLLVSNPSSGDIPTVVRWTTRDPQGKVVAAMSGERSYTVGPFDTYLQIRDQIPPGATEGWYSMDIEVISQGQASAGAGGGHERSPASGDGVAAQAQTRFKGTAFWVSGRSGMYLAYLPTILRGDMVTPPPSGWVTIMAEDFEGTFPGSWRVFDDQPSQGEYYWGKRTCRPYGGGHSGWAVGAASYGTALNCGSNYPNETEAWMIYGPFSLADATEAELAFWRWQYSEDKYDVLKWMASVDGTNFRGYQTSGSSGGWKERVFDLSSVPELGDMRGRSQVWVALVFQSDGNVNHPEGAYVDNIVLRKKVGATSQSLLAEPESAVHDPGHGDSGIEEAQGTFQGDW
jgi:hypothetical protein